MSSPNGVQPICNGYGVKSKDWKISFVTLALLLIPSSIFLAFTLRYFITEYSHYPSLLIGIFLILFSIFTLLRTTYSDPGILPSRHDIPETILNYFKSTAKTKVYHDFGKVDRIKKHELESGEIIQSRWCYTCNIWRTPRASHCSSCKVCIDEFDHHCPWVGNCVAKRNYRFFFLFITSSLILSFYGLGYALAHVIIESTKKNDKGNNVGLWVGIKKAPASVFLVIYTVIAILSVIGLWGYHVSLVWKGKTTSEDIKKKKYSNRVGFLKRLFTFCFGPIMPSAIEPMYIHERNDEDQDEMNEHFNPYDHSYSLGSEWI